MGKKNRHKAIKEIILANEVVSQDMLLNLLIDKGFDVTQATLSRDIKELRLVKAPTMAGAYAYQFPDTIKSIEDASAMPLSTFGFISIEFSGSLAVIKTRPGYAMAIAGEIDSKARKTILGTVAGDDTILLIPREGIDRKEVTDSLAVFIPSLNE